MIIVRLLSPGPWLVGTTKAYSGIGADIVMESIALTILSWCKRLISTVELKTLEDRTAPVEVWWLSPDPFRAADRFPLGSSANPPFGFPRFDTNRNHREFFLQPQFP